MIHTLDESGDGSVVQYGGLNRQRGRTHRLPYMWEAMSVLHQNLEMIPRYLLVCALFYVGKAGLHYLLQ